MIFRSIAVLLCCARINAQVASPPPQPLSNPPTAPMVRPDPGTHWRKATVALGYVLKIGSESKFVVTGTAVVVNVDLHRGCLLTAKHMLVDPNTGQVTRAMWMRVASEKGEVQPPIQLTLFDALGHNTWVATPDSDLAVIPIPNEALHDNIDSVSIAEFAKTDEDVFQGAPILVLGYPQVFRRADQTTPYSTSPIARSGVIAWVDPATPLLKPFLVDANLYGGNSGGPVFRVRQGFDRYGSFNLGNAGYTFIGIVSQGPITTAPVIAGDGTVTRPNPQTGIPENEFAAVPYVGGIGVIEPASRALALLEQVFKIPHTP